MSESSATQTWTDYLVAYGVLVRDGEVLLVGNRWRWSERDELVWTLPGGRSEPGEPIHESLVREFREETGIDVTPGPLAFVVEVHLPKHRQRFTSFTFLVDAIGPVNPAVNPTDDAVEALRFFPLAETPERLSLHTMRAALAEYLTAGPDASRYFYFLVDE